jgi:hypothetical protein
LPDDCASLLRLRIRSSAAPQCPQRKIVNPGKLSFMRMVDCAGVRGADGRWVWWLQRPAVELLGAEFGLRFLVDPDRPVPREFQAAALARFSPNSKELVCFGSGQAQPGESKPSGLVHGQKRSSALEDRATFLPRRAMHRSRRLVHHWAEIAVYLASAVSEFTRPRIVSALRRSGRSRLRQARPSFGRGSVASAVVLFQAAASIPKYQCCHLGRSPAGQIPCER